MFIKVPKKYSSFTSVQDKRSRVSNEKTTKLLYGSCQTIASDFGLLYLEVQGIAFLRGALVVGVFWFVFFCFGLVFVVVLGFFLREIGESWFVNSDFSLLSHVSHGSDLTVMFLICGCIRISGFDWQVS